MEGVKIVQYRALSMSGRRIANRALLVLLLMFTLTSSGCSYFTDFVVINQSKEPIEIRYKVKRSTAGPLAVSGIPATVLASELSPHGGEEWQPMSSGQYEL